MGNRVAASTIMRSDVSRLAKILGERILWGWILTFWILGGAWLLQNLQVRKIIRARAKAKARIDIKASTKAPNTRKARKGGGIIIALLCATLAQNLHANRSDFEQLGDVLKLAPVGVLIVSLGMEDYEGAAQLVAGSLVTQGAIEVIKKSFEFAHDRGWGELGFAKRPCCDDWKGMPSGHAGGSFSAAGFVYYRYGWKPALPLIGLGIITDASRVVARKHTVWQVLAGSAIAWGFAWVFTTPYKPRKVLILPDISTDVAGKAVYGVNLSYTW